MAAGQHRPWLLRRFGRQLGSRQAAQECLAKKRSRTPACRRRLCGGGGAGPRGRSVAGPVKVGLKSLGGSASCAPVGRAHELSGSGPC